jgi:hypothetical protein
MYCSVLTHSQGAMDGFIAILYPFNDERINGEVKSSLLTTAEYLAVTAAPAAAGAGVSETTSAAATGDGAVAEAAAAAVPGS